jgi:hypothetical protein
MYYQSKIIVGIYSYLQDHTNKDIEDLFSNAVDLFNALGSWIYGEASPNIVYPELQLFVRKANTGNTEDFLILLNYINWVGSSLFKILKDNKLIEDHYYESFTLKQSKDITTGLLFMWRLGWLYTNMREISSENKTEIAPQFQVAFGNLYNAFGNWIYHQDGIVNLTPSNIQFEKETRGKFDLIYNEILEEMKTTCRNITKFLQIL